LSAVNKMGMNKSKFITEVGNAYAFTGKSIVIGGAVLENTPIPDIKVQLPLSTINRHGLIAGATGTGKTKSIQRLAEALSEQGVNVLLMDIKGDISGISKPGTINQKISERMKLLGIPWNSTGYPTELLTISNETGVRLRATVSEFGPVLLSKILELNENQEGTIAIIFKYCDDKKLPLLDLNDLRAVLQHITSGEGKKEVEENYGAISTSTSGVIMRKLLELEQQGGEKFFGERSFEVEDLLQKDSSGMAYINILRLTDIQDKPKLFSSFMLSLLAEIYSKFPEIGDKGEPRLVVFIDEAHLIFREASKALLEQLETIIKLIRSKGVGIYFCTQAPTDIPDEILSQLGTKIQHALRAFTAKDRKDINLISENFPLTEYYKTNELITELGIGEALVTVLSEKGTPTPLVHTMMSAPQSRMDVLSQEEQKIIVESSEIARIYNEEVDRDSAFEILKGKIKYASSQNTRETNDTKEENEPEKPSQFAETLMDLASSPVAKTIAREVTRGLLGALLGKPSRSSGSRRR
jgi:uncharacterized protein